MAGTVRATVRGPEPGAGIYQRPALSLSDGQRVENTAASDVTHEDVEVNVRIPRIGQPSSRAVFAFITMSTTAPWASMNYEGV